MTLYPASAPTVNLDGTYDARPPGPGADPTGRRELVPPAAAARDATLLSVYQLLRKFAARATRNPADAADLAQESALCFLAKWHTFDGVHTTLFAGWMVAQARHRLFGRRRVEAGPLLPGTDEPGVYDDPPPVVRSEEEAEKADRLRRLRAALAQLPERRRAIVAGRFGLDGSARRTLADLAGGLGRTKELVRQQEAKALAQLAQLITARTTTPQEAGHAA